MRQKSLKDVRDMYKETDMRCEGCNSEVDTQPHVLVCGAYRDLRESRDLRKDGDMVNKAR
jgi:hypothetical protein